jgi:hypothetical protein
MPPSPPRADVPEAVRVQILATEHWSLLATRSFTYGEIFNRTSIFLTVVSAAVVALALVGQATNFGDRFYVFALLVLPVALFIGLVTFIRLIDAWLEDFWLVYGMNRLRHAYLEIAPELEPYFVTGHHDDPQGVYETYGPHTHMRLYRLLASTHMVVGVIDGALAGVIVGLLAATLGARPALSIVTGAVVTSVSIVFFAHTSRRFIDSGRRSIESRFGRQVDVPR